MRILRTPDERFAGLPGWDFEPRYATVDDGDGGELRMHFVDEGPAAAAPVLLLHGEPSWSYLYRKMIPVFVAAGMRAVAIDLAGFGRSDKPADGADYTYQRHVDWVRSIVDQLDLRDTTLFCQDWGGLIGLRLVAEAPERYARVVASNTFLPTGDQPLGESFFAWQKASQEMPVFDIGRIVARGCATSPEDDVVAAYDAPFPEESFKAGARQFPLLVPSSPDDPAAPANRAAWEVLSTFDKPFLTIFGADDPITLGAERFLQALIPGAEGRDHVILEGAGHFLQEDRGEHIAQLVVDFIRSTQDEKSASTT
jgi:haloalkane dehalogenase